MASKGQPSPKDLAKLLELENNNQHILTMDPLKKLFSFYLSIANREKAKETLYRLATNANIVIKSMVFPLVNKKIQASTSVLSSSDNLFASDVFNISEYLQYLFSLSGPDEWAAFHNTIPSWKSVLKFILIDFSSLIEHMIDTMLGELSASLKNRIHVQKSKIMSIILSCKLFLYQGFELKDAYKFLVTKLDLHLHGNGEYSYFLDRLSILELEFDFSSFSVVDISKSMIQYCWAIETSNVIDVRVVAAKFPDFFNSQARYSYGSSDPLVQTNAKYPYAKALSDIYVFYSKIFKAIYHLDANSSINNSTVSELAKKSYLHGLLGRSKAQQLLLNGDGYFSHLVGLILVDSFTMHTKHLFLKISNDGVLIFKHLGLTLSVSLYSLSAAVALSSTVKSPENIAKCASLASVVALPSAFKQWNVDETNSHLELMLLAVNYFFDLYLADASFLHPCTSINSSKALAFGDDVNHLIGALSKVPKNSEYTSALLSVLTLTTATSTNWALYFDCLENEAPILTASLSEHLATCISLLEQIKTQFVTRLLNKFLPVLHLALLRIAMMLLGGPFLSNTQTLRLSQTFSLSKNSFTLPDNPIFKDHSRLHLSLRALSIIIGENTASLPKNGICRFHLQFESIVSCAYSLFSLYYLFLGIYTMPQNKKPLFIQKAADCATRSLSFLPGMENELSTYCLLLTHYFNWLNSQDKIVDLRNLLVQIRPISIASNVKAINTPTTSSSLLLRCKAQILLCHPQITSDSISDAICSLQCALRSQYLHAPTWLLLADAYELNCQYIAAFKGYAKVITLEPQHPKLANLVVKMATCLFKSKSYALCLKFIIPLIEDLEKIDLSFIEEDNPLEIPAPIVLSEPELAELKLVSFESLLLLSRELFDLGEVGHSFELVGISYDFVPFALERSEIRLLNQLFSFTSAVFDSRAIGIIQKDKPAQFEALCQKICQSCLYIHSHKLFKHLLDVECVSPSVPNYDLHVSIRKETKNCYLPVLASKNCKSLLLLTKTYFDISLLEKDQFVANWLQLANSLILLDICNLIDSNRISPCIFAILRGLCAICIEQKEPEHSAAIWLTTGKWLITKNSLLLAQHALMVALELCISLVCLFA
ncbi:hypothetical protein MDAP_002287 [Mitosporidium daphniae]|uniref:Uncharacterized protein n=1 Tax=Mitosporidium daphniae TaxID=1485682 RepID=A0A098VP31_9MICR|nr:uncharacterized protein DI09_65p70 [Mitosporidium daphniae]KGG50559.1 hypothetical protein DI09_65p70 [Mitosporidium daphniae]|eukprot:XP_013236998.1 uncharacterized protein DI09_65p70 [Mitosporidium daphniae]